MKIDYIKNLWHILNVVVNGLTTVKCHCSCDLWISRSGHFCHTEHLVLGSVWKFLPLCLYYGEKKAPPHTLVIKVASGLPCHYCIPNHDTQVQPTVPAGRQLAAQCRINWYQYAGL